MKTSLVPLLHVAVPATVVGLALTTFLLTAPPGHHRFLAAQPTPSSAHGATVPAASPLAQHAAALVPADVGSVDVVVERPGGAPTVRRTLDAPAARSLAKLVNRQRLAAPGAYACPDDRGFTDTLTFPEPRGPIRVTARVGGCHDVSVTRHGARQVTTTGGVALDDAVTAALGLPRDYGD